MLLRQTKSEDISRVIEIINQAKNYFKEKDRKSTRLNSSH